MVPNEKPPPPPPASDLLARVMWMLDIHDDAMFEIGFYRQILRRDPNNVDALRRQAKLLSDNGACRQALVLSRRLAALRPGDHGALYNLACNLVLTRRSDEALETLRNAILHGFNDLDQLRSDEDLDSLRDDPRFMEVLHELAAIKATGEPSIC
ncbi:MAG TPA: hypothetical protein VFW87_10450 [Pirellulales bacterium]|nr:hypothetical protein [Pirellulales bacterium]